MAISISGSKISSSLNNMSSTLGSMNMNSNLSLNTSSSMPGMNGNLSLDMFSNMMSMGSMNMTTTMNAFGSMSSNATGASGVNFNIWGNGSVNPSGRINTDAPTYVIIHGWRNTGGNASNGYKPGDWLANQAQTLRQRESNANIIMVDWEKDAGNVLYFPSVGKTQDVGNQLSAYLKNSGVDPNYTTLIGHSLGAHVAGFAGSAYRQSTGKAINQIVGLDPAGPAFESKGAGDRLDPTDANRVVAIHTSIVLGYNDRLGTLDIYANKSDWFQPGQSIIPKNFLGGNHTYGTTLFTELLQGNSFTQSNGSVLNLNTVVNAGFTGENNASTKNNKGVVALNLSGTANNDNLAGGAANDNIRGGVGNDKISGGDGNDALFGDSSHDILNGGRGNDSVFGGAGGDRLFGDEGDDVLTGADAAVGRGAGEIERLTGGVGRDRFVLGATQGAFYSDNNISTSGISDYALISDFNALEDTIQLSGPKSRYSLGASPAGLAAGTAIFLNESRPELIAIVQGSTNLNLSANYFVNV
jgi:Ca2+-binding RTX toxin-like protein